MVRPYFARPIRKRPRQFHKFHPYVSHMNDVCHDDHICNACMEAYAAEAQHNRPDHVWAVDEGKIVYLEDVVYSHHLGRDLKPTESIVHRNGDVTDNRLENLELITIDTLETE